MRVWNTAAVTCLSMLESIWTLHSYCQTRAPKMHPTLPNTGPKDTGCSQDSTMGYLWIMVWRWWDGDWMVGLEQRKVDYGHHYAAMCVCV